MTPSSPVPPRFIAHYLPQFHPIPENDTWWGKGFTEWTNVSRAQPLFRGHRQPHFPADLGYYDLRSPEVRESQVALARRYGVSGFMYYHYWFGGKRLINRPFDEVLRSGKPDFPFCLCWANETWSRRWLGDDREVLIKQSYSPEDFRAHGRWLAKVFSDRRYLRVNERPVFVIYRFMDFPKEYDGIRILREEIMRNGADNPFLIAVNVHNRKFDYLSAGFDHTLAFQPSLGAPKGALNDEPFSAARLLRNLRLGVLNGRIKLYDYEAALDRMDRELEEAPASIPCQLVSWDNSPRRGEKAVVFSNCGPKAFSQNLERRLHRWAESRPDTDLFFVNAWNEWAEGNHLEPDTKFGHAYLEALRDTRNRVGEAYSWPKV